MAFTTYIHEQRPGDHKQVSKYIRYFQIMVTGIKGKHSKIKEKSKNDMVRERGDFSFL